MTEFASFLTAREAASTAFVDGEVEPLLAVSVTSDPATIYPPPGIVIEGADDVNEANRRSAESFASGAANRFDVLHSGADGDLGYWTGIQRSSVRMDGAAEPVQMDLRVTELFRRVDGEWKLFHRHADPLRPDVPRG